MKSEIVEELGQADLLLPARIAEGLAANERAKAHLSILQAAAHRAQAPNGARFDLAEECRAAGIDPLAMERLVGSARLSADGRLSASGLANLRAAITDDVAAMAKAVRVADAAGGDQALFSDRAVTYRKLEHLENLAGTAVAVQAMVFGNNGAGSGAGVAFSRDPSSGAAEPVIDVLFDSQGEDVVSGRRNPQTEQAIAQALPDTAAQLRDALVRLEREFNDVQDVEFTIEDGKLWILQTRAAKRTPQAALRFAVDFVGEGRITPAEALTRLQGIDLSSLVTNRLVDAGDAVTHGIGASSGIAVGRAAFACDSARRLAQSGEPVILLRPDTSTADVAGFAVSAGIVTAVGGRTAHAALVARQMGKACIVACERLSVDAAGRAAQVADHTLNEGDWLSIDGGSGEIYLGRGKVIGERPTTELAEIERWRLAITVINPHSVSSG